MNLPTSDQPSIGESLRLTQKYMKACLCCAKTHPDEPWIFWENFVATSAAFHNNNIMPTAQRGGGSVLQGLGDLLNICCLLVQ